MRKLACPPEVEVIGSNVLSILENLNAKEIKPFAIKHGLDSINAEEWYELSRWLGLLNDLAENINLTQNLVAIGMKLAEKVIMPPQMADATYADVLLSWDHVYHHQHRGGEIGHHHVEQVSDTYFQCTFTDVYPDDLKYGIAHGFGRRFLPPGTPITIAYESPDHRMDKGGANETVMTIDLS